MTKIDPGAPPAQDPVEQVNKFFDLDKPPAEGDPPPAVEGDPPPAESDPPPPAVEGDPPPQDERLTKSYDDLIRRDRELQARQERLRADEQDLRAFRALREQAAQDPGSALRALGIDPFGLSDRLLGIDPPASKEQDPPRDTLTRAEAEQLVQQQIAHQQQVWQHQQQISQMIAGSDHELLRDIALRNPGIVGDIYNEAVRRFQDTGSLPDIPAILAEREHREEATMFAALDKVLQLGKVKARYGQISSGKETPQAPTRTPPGAAGKTLSNTKQEEPNREERPMTKEEKWAEFHRALRDGAPEGFKDDI